MTVGELRSRMSALEFQQWNVYYGRLNQQHELAAMRARRR